MTPEERAGKMGVVAQKRLPVFKLYLGTREAAVIVRSHGRSPLLVTGPSSVRTFGRWRQTIFVDMNPLTLHVMAEHLETTDGVDLAVRAVVDARVVNPVDAAVKVVDYSEATCQMSETVIRAIVRERSSADLRDRTAEIEAAVLEEVKSNVSTWGVEVSTVHIAPTSDRYGR
jgi:hypothetical protein